jgi:hypothetical protein
MSAPIPSSNGHKPSPREELSAIRLENRLRNEKLKSARLERWERREKRMRNTLETISIDWITPYVELLDLTRRSGDPIFTGPATYWQRRQGRNWPIYQTEQELALLRAPARMLLATNSYAQGLVEGLTSYVLGSGCTYRITKASDKDDLPDDLIDAAQDVVDRILEHNQWFGGELPGIEEELFGRSIEDGEFILAHFPREDGMTDFRPQEPEQLTQPPGANFQEYGFGILTNRDDAQLPLMYYLQYGETPMQGEEHEPEYITHFRRNVRRAMKRGISDFCFDSYDALYSASRLRSNLGEAAAQQASLVGIRQWENGSQDDVSAFNDQDADFQESDPLTGNQMNVKFRKKGDWEDIPKGMNYVPGPIAQSQPIHLQVLDNILRAGGQKWQAPPWLMSGDLNAMNYATSLTAESPFVKTVLRRQPLYCNAFRRPIWFAFKHYVTTHGLRDRTGKVWRLEDIEHRIKLKVTAPSPETRNKLEEAQRAGVEIPLGVQSRQNYMQEQGRDVDQIEADNQAYQDKFGSPGQQLPIPGEGSAQGGGAGSLFPSGDSETSSMESLLESFDEVLSDDTYRNLMEAGRAGLVKKEITNKSGKKEVVWINPNKKKPGAKQRSKEKPTQTKNHVPEKQMSEKALRAQASATRVDSEIQRYAEEHNEPAFAKAIDGLSFKDNEPVDVVMGDKGVVQHGIELKTMVSNKANKITMKRSAMDRKAQWEKDNKATFHTVVIDDHAVFNANGPGQHDESKRVIYYRRGFGSFRVPTMHKVADLDELKKLINMPNKELPDAAKRVGGK